MKYISIVDIDKYIHYKDRNIIWIKFYPNEMNEFFFHKLEDNERWWWWGLIVLGVKNDNKIPFDVPFITDFVSFKKKFNRKHLDKCLKTIQKLIKLKRIMVKLW